MATATEATQKKKGGAAKATSKSSVIDPPAPEPTVDGDDNNADDEQASAEESEAEKAQREHEEQLDILEPLAEPRRWIIGKPPEAGGTDDEYSIYVQRPLDYMPRLRFFSLVTRTVSQAIKAGGVMSVGGGDLFGGGGGTMRQRLEKIQSGAFEDAGSFMTLALELISYSPDFLLECYCLWLSIPSGEKAWAKAVMNQPHDPESQKWGLTQKQHLEIVEIFIDQNYEDIRDFFAVDLPRIARRAQAKERERQARESESDPSKQ